MRKFIDFIKSIQASDEATKKFWFYIFSGILTGVIVLVWAAGVKTLLPRLDLGQESEIVAQEKHDSGIVKTFMAGLSAVVDETKLKLKESRSVELTPEKYQYEPTPEAYQISPKNLPVGR